MSLVPHTCPGCTYGGTHLVGCENDTSQHVDIPPIPSINLDEAAPIVYSAVPIPNGETWENEGGSVYNESIKLPKVEGSGASIIDQKIEPSVGTRLVCTRCGRGDWHTLVLRRKAGLLEGLCKQLDGSGCYPSSPRRNCQYTDADNFDCAQVAEYSVALGEERLNPRDVCRDHIGHMLRQGPLYQIWPLED